MKLTRTQKRFIELNKEKMSVEDMSKIIGQPHDKIIDYLKTYSNIFEKKRRSGQK